mmetsp:Transcript_15935/g.27454  ORF Transcript_15935/g.27454 Transcript_15935/m.27454 type:complete len:80 (+) Transcript_15935:162-401(+)
MISSFDKTIICQSAHTPLPPSMPVSDVVQQALFPYQTGVRDQGLPPFAMSVPRSLRSHCLWAALGRTPPASQAMGDLTP